MGWIKDGRTILQQKYGYYCELCRKLRLEPVPYHSFTINLLDELKLKLK